MKSQGRNYDKMKPQNLDHERMKSQGRNY
ncbi:hypothetical protein JOD89_006252, partial [Priestia megaterium]